MSYSSITLPVAINEYEDAVDWYRSRDVGAADRFIKEVEDAIELICEHPDRWRSELTDFREVIVKKYPYSIVYSVDHERKIVLISSIYHHSRNPKKKYRK